jgi:hypothetical protein
LKETRMIRKIGTLALLLASLASFAQTEPTAAPAAATPAKRYSRPDIPGTFLLELGVNRALDAPSRFDQGFWGSRTLNVYYQYDMRILHSKFFFVPGVGFSFERWKFVNGRTPGYLNANSSNVDMLTATEAKYPADLKKSMLITNYFEIPVEIKFMTNPNDPARSFKASIGGRAGFMYDAFTKVKYSENGENKKVKNNQNYNLTRLRYGISAKIGVGNIALFGYYNLTPLFEENKGPKETDNTNRDITTFTIGLSLSSF